MKLIALTLLTGALTLHGTAFFGVWTAPGLEHLPSFADISGQTAKEEAARQAEETKIMPIAAMDEWLPVGVSKAVVQ